MEAVKTQMLWRTCAACWLPARAMHGVFAGTGTAGLSPDGPGFAATGAEVVLPVDSGGAHTTLREQGMATTIDNRKDARAALECMETSG